MYNCMTYLFDELGEFLVESQIDHGPVLACQLNPEMRDKRRTPPTTKIALKSLALTSLILIVSFQTF
jgi:hypothetical protein